LSWIRNSADFYKDWEIIGFIDDDLNALEKFDYDLPIVSTISDYVPKNDEYLIMAMGNPKNKMRLVEYLKKRGASFITFIHKSATIGINTKIGNGCVLCPNSIVTCDVEIGEFVTINIFSSAGHDAKIGEGSTLSGHVDITGHVEVGKGVFIGSNVSILPKVKVGDRAVIGAGSIVVKNVKDGKTVFGNPAKAIN